jgi:hypothetical protein
MLLGCAHGCTATAMLARGFSSEMLSALARNGLATIQPVRMHAGRQESVVWMMITEPGRQALAER